MRRREEDDTPVTLTAAPPASVTHTSATQASATQTSTTLSGAMRIPFGRPWITEDDRRAVLAVLDGTTLTQGPESRGFEREFAEFLGGDAHCVAVSSGMAALHLAALHIGIGPGDEVLVPAQAHTSTVHAVVWTGATPVFVDCDGATGNMRPEAIAAAITPRTRAIYLVHFLGVPCDMPGIMAIADAHKLRVVEDCALAVGSRVDGTHVGLFGDAGCFSFFPSKHLTTGEGGMFISRHADAAAEVTRRRAFGVDRGTARAARPWEYDVTSLGVNYRMDEMSAALGRSQFRRIDENLARRRETFDALSHALLEIDAVDRVLMSSAPNLLCSHYCLSLVLDAEHAPARDTIARGLHAAGIGTSVYYPHPVPRLQYYRERYGWDASKYPHAVDISEASIALPVGSHVSPADVAYMADAMLTILRGVVCE